ncbi:MAG: dihydroxy-acid dehydratase [Burkholderiales bacterium]|jgi:dihydroxy-acid dehydratase
MAKSDSKKASLRSQDWFSPDNLRSFAHRQRMQQVGYSREEFLDVPVIGVFVSWNGFSTCHSHLRDRATAVMRGIRKAGGLPIEFPVMSLGEVMVKPTSMLYRNLMAMEVEEMLRAHPFDGAVLMGGCDKTVPGLIMGALSADIPFVFVPAGPALGGRWNGEKVGAGTHTKIFWDKYRAGEISKEDWVELESSMIRSAGTCNTMGTASTMALAVEALGLSISGSSSIPAVDSAHERMCFTAGQRAVSLVKELIRPLSFLSKAHFLNAIRVICASGGSTNALIHLIAIAGRAGVSLDLDDFDVIARETPILVDLMPAGNHLMQDFYFAGGLPTLLSRLRPFLEMDTLTVENRTLESLLEEAQPGDSKIIRRPDNPVSDQPAFAVLKGNLAPHGAVIKPSSMDTRLMSHCGEALVFEGPEDLALRIDDPSLKVDSNTVLVLRGGGPITAPGMPEWGNLPIPKKLLLQGVKDMLRLSDARMSGTHFGACVLHISPESSENGALGLVKDGDLISIDVDKRSIELKVDLKELDRRRSSLPISEKPSDLGASAERGYIAMHKRHIEQAHQGCDLDFLKGFTPMEKPKIF